MVRRPILTFGDLKSICKAFDSFMDDTAPIYIDIDGIEFEVESLVNGQGNYPASVTGKTETASLGRRIRRLSERDTKRGVRLLSHVQSILDNMDESTRISREKENHLLEILQ